MGEPGIAFHDLDQVAVEHIDVGCHSIFSVHASAY
jgi:hypothetical protein